MMSRLTPEQIREMNSAAEGLKNGAVQEVTVFGPKGEGLTVYVGSDETQSDAAQQVSDLANLNFRRGGVVIAPIKPIS